MTSRDPGCFSCGQLARTDTLAPREQIVSFGGWYVTHAFNSSLPGWLVVVAERHVESLADLSISEASALGVVLRACSVALRESVGANKSYVMFFAEQDGFRHTHVHVVPRASDIPDDRRGPSVFAYLKDPAELTVSDDDQDALARTLAGVVVRELDADLSDASTTLQ